MIVQIIWTEVIILSMCHGKFRFSHKQQQNIWNIYNLSLKFYELSFVVSTRYSHGSVCVCVWWHQIEMWFNLWTQFLLHNMWKCSAKGFYSYILHAKKRESTMATMICFYCNLYTWYDKCVELFCCCCFFMLLANDFSQYIFSVFVIQKYKQQFITWDDGK